MPGKKNQSLLNKLKKQVKDLQKKEKQGRRQLATTLKKMHRMAKGYKSKLANKVRLFKTKASEAQSSAYAKIAADLQKQMSRSIEAKAKSLQGALSKLEKKHITKLAKSLTKKTKPRRKKKSNVKNQNVASRRKKKVDKKKRKMKRK